MPEQVFQLAKTLRQESRLWITGVLHQDSRSTFGYTITVRKLQLVGDSHDYPITPKETGLQFLLDHRTLWLRSKRQFAIQQIRNTNIRATFTFFNNTGFIKMDPPIYTDSAPTGTTTLFTTHYLHKLAYLSQSGQLYATAGAMAYGKVFTCGPVFRATKSKTRRTYTEFWNITPTMAFCTQTQSLKVQERYVAYMVQAVLDNCAYPLTLLGRDPTVLKQYTLLHYPRLSYKKAITMLQAAGMDVKYGQHFGSPTTTYLSDQLHQPVFVLLYPKALKPF